MERVWFITGASRGFGRAFTEEAVKRGDKVIATVRRVPHDDIFKHPSVLTVVMDVTKTDEVEKGHQGWDGSFWPHRCPHQ